MAGVQGVQDAHFRVQRARAVPALRTADVAMGIDQPRQNDLPRRQRPDFRTGGHGDAPGRPHGDDLALMHHEHAIRDRFAGDRVDAGAGPGEGPFLGGNRGGEGQQKQRGARRGETHRRDDASSGLGVKGSFESPAFPAPQVTGRLGNGPIRSFLRGRALLAPPHPMASSARKPHVWQRFRTGGLDQVALTSGADLAALDQLDPKLWVALACPVKGLALDERTLDLIDTDRDGRIRVPEVQAAVRWAVAQVRAPDCLLQGANGLPLAALREDTEEGKANLACAGRILQFHGRPAASTLTVDDVTAFRHRPDGMDLRGDGVILPAAGETEPVRQALADLVAVTGGQPSAAGTRGVTREQVARCQADFLAWQAWQAAGAASGVRPAGEATPAVAAAVRAVRGKVDDYFSRCRLAAFDPRALGALNRAEADYQL
ncbi:MAG: hypothetical protein RL479_2653, partial [Verrucomicrobiota bacterium]